MNHLEDPMNKLLSFHVQNKIKDTTGGIMNVSETILNVYGSILIAQEGN